MTSPYDRRRRYDDPIYAPDHFMVQHIRAFVEQQIRQITRGMTVADVGCGEQPFRDLIESRGAHYLGIDVAQNAQGTVDVIADVANIPIRDSQFDVVLCVEVLEHMPDVVAAFKEWARILGPSGLLLVTTPFCYPLHEEPYDFQRLTPYQIARICRLAGLDLRTLRRAGHELEAATLLWSHMLVPLAKRCPALVRKPALYACGGLIAIAQLSVKLLTRVIGTWIGQRNYLSTQCILTRRAALPSHADQPRSTETA